MRRAVFIEPASAMDNTNQECRRSNSKMAVGLPHITSFCCCLGLEMGTKIIGFLHLVLSGVLMIVCSISAESARSFRGTVEDEDGLYTTWYKLTVTVAVLSTAHVLLSILLLYSAYKRFVRGLYIWVWTMCALCAAAVLYLVVQLVMKGFSNGSGSDIFLSFLEGVLVFGYLLYCILCVYSYYLMLRSSEDMEGPGKVYY